jgi:RecA/RadA recombinase
VTSRLREKLLKNTTIEQTAVLSQSKIFGKKDVISTDVPVINVALSGDPDGGLTPGLTLICGDSKNFKTSFTLLLASAFLRKYDDGIILFYDSEFGSSESYISSFDIDPSRIVHTPITDIEHLKHDIVKQLDGIERDDKVIIMIDSIGNLSSRKEAEDALEGKSAADMTRAKQLKSLFRIITPHLTIKDIPLIAVNHIYKEMSVFPRDIVGGGTGVYLSSDNIWIVGRQQDKDKTTKEVLGYNFIINIEKSRFVREKSKIPVEVSYEGGINRWSGLLDLALEGGFIISPKMGRYARKHVSEDMAAPLKRNAIENNDAFWSEVFTNTDFKGWLKTKFQLPGTSMLIVNQ